MADGNGFLPAFEANWVGFVGLSDVIAAKRRRRAQCVAEIAKIDAEFAAAGLATDGPAVAAPAEAPRALPRNDEQLPLRAYDVTVPDARAVLNDAERLRALYVSCRCVVAETARRLGMSQKTVRYRLDRFGIDTNTGALLPAQEEEVLCRTCLQPFRRPVRTHRNHCPPCLRESQAGRLARGRAALAAHRDAPFARVDNAADVPAAAAEQFHRQEAEPA